MNIIQVKIRNKNALSIFTSRQKPQVTSHKPEQQISPGICGLK